MVDGKEVNNGSNNNKGNFDIIRSHHNDNLDAQVYFYSNVGNWMDSLNMNNQNNQIFFNFNYLMDNLSNYNFNMFQDFNNNNYNNNMNFNNSNDNSNSNSNQSRVNNSNNERDRNNMSNSSFGNNNNNRNDENSANSNNAIRISKYK